MKKSLLLITSFLAILFGASCTANNKIESLRRLGAEEFSSDKWSKADEIGRGKMIYDFITKNQPITSKDRGFVISQLGESTGYHDYDTYPAYYVGPKPPKSEAKAYLVAFIIDHDTGKIKDIYIEPEIK